MEPPTLVALGVRVRIGERVGVPPCLGWIDVAGIGGPAEAVADGCGFVPITGDAAAVTLGSGCGSAVAPTEMEPTGTGWNVETAGTPALGFKRQAIAAPNPATTRIAAPRMAGRVQLGNPGC